MDNLNHSPSINLDHHSHNNFCGSSESFIHEAQINLMENRDHTFYHMSLEIYLITNLVINQQTSSVAEASFTINLITLQ